MNGCVIPYTPIAVDFWKVRQCPRVRLFFLSHVHLETSCGITSSWSLPIYCSAISKKLLIHQFQLNPDVIHELELGVPHSISLTPTDDVTMTVTLIDANHCPGSVMFLFDGYFGRILYTGDFRYSEAMLTNGGLLGDLVTNPIDVLYLDNTFCSPKCAFPPHDEALKLIIAIIEQHPDDRVMFGMRSLGKEDMLIAISEFFNEKIAISSERYKVLQLLGMHERFVVCGDSKEAKPRFEVVSLVEVTRSNVDAWNKSSSTIAILPTALFEGLGFQPFVSSSDIFVVPYSDHSPFAELHQFVSGIRPKSVIPIVRADVSARDDPLAESLLDRANVECFADCLDRTPMQNYHIPASVLEMMNQNSAGTGQAKKRATRNGNRRQICKQNVSRLHVGTAKSEHKSLLRKISVSSDNLESCLSAATDIAGATHEQTGIVEHELSHSSVTTNVAPVPRATHVLKPHVLVRPMKRCSSSDRLLALAMRPSSYVLKQRLGRMSAGASGIAHSSIPLPQSCVRLKSTVANVNPVFSLVRGRRDRPQVLQHRVSRCQGTVINNKTQVSDQHSIELSCGEESKFVYTDRVLVPSDKSSQIEMTDTPLNLSQSAMLQLPVNGDVYLPADSSNSSLEQHVSCDYSQYHVSEQICSASNVSPSSDLYNLDCAAIAVSSLLSLSNGDAQTQQFSYLPTHLSRQTENAQDESTMSNGVAWPSSMATETVMKSSSGSVEDADSECITNLVSLASTQKSPTQNHAIDLHMESAAIEFNGDDRAEDARYKESGTLTDFRQLHQIINITDVSADVVGLAKSFAGSHAVSGFLPHQAMVHVNSNSSSGLMQQRLPAFVDNGLLHYSESVSNDEPHDYSMTPTTVTDSLCAASQPVSSAANEQLVCSAACCASLQTACLQDRSDSAGTNWTDARFESTTSVDDPPFLRTSSTVVFDRDNLSSISDSMSSVTRENTEVCLPRSELSDSSGENFSAAASTTGVMLPPKKNWRRRYHRSSQLNRAHQENKRFPGYVVADSDRTEGRRSPAIKRPLSRGRSDVLINPGQPTDGKSMLSSEEVGQDCESNRPLKRPPLVASHSFHHLALDSRLQAVEKSVLKANPANMRRHIITDECARQVGCLSSTGLLDSDKKRVMRSLWEGKISRPTLQPTFCVKQQTSVVESSNLPNSISTLGVVSSLPLDLSAYHSTPEDSSIDCSKDCRDTIV